MPIPSRATLKSFFETGDQPTQAQFAALIDAMYDMVQDATATAEAAVALVEATLPKCMGALRVDMSSGAVQTSAKFREQDCTFTITAIGVTQTFNSVSGGDAYRARWRVDVVFNTVAANTAYTCNFAILAGNTTAGCSFYVDVPCMQVDSASGYEPVWDNVTFTIWP